MITARGNLANGATGMTRSAGTGFLSSDLVRQLLIGGGIVGVLLCSILGSSVLTLQEQGGVPVAAITRTPTQTATREPTWTALPPTMTVTPTSTPFEEMPPKTDGTPTNGTPTNGTPFEETPSPTETATASPAPTQTPTSVPTVIQPTPQTCGRPPGWQPYLVQRGDTLTGLALRSGTTVAAIINANCLKSTVIFAGQRLYLPRALIYPTWTPTSTPTLLPPTMTPTLCVISPPAGWSIYIVQSGDSLYDLALRHGTTIYEVRRVNCLSSDAISPGQQLYLPALLPTATPTWTLVPSSTLTVPVATPTIETPTPTVETPVVETPTPTVETPTPTIETPVVETPTPTVETPTPTIETPTIETPTAVVPTATSEPTPTTKPTSES